MVNDDLLANTKGLLSNRASTVFDDTWYFDRLNTAYGWLATFDDKTGGRKRSIRFAEFYDQITRVLPALPSTNFVANSPNVFSILSLWDTTNARRIRRKSATFIANRNPAEEGSILNWAPSGSDESGTRTAGYRVWKKPDVTTTVIENVYLIPETLAASASIGPVIPAAWHDAIYLKAAAYAALLMGLKSEAADFHSAAVTVTRDLRLSADDSFAYGPRRFSVMERI